jgi:hypothetical protein
LVYVLVRLWSGLNANCMGEPKHRRLPQDQRWVSRPQIVQRRLLDRRWLTLALEKVVRGPSETTVNSPPNTHNLVFRRTGCIRVGSVSINAATGHFHRQPYLHIISPLKFIMSPKKVITPLSDLLLFSAIGHHGRQPLGQGALFCGLCSQLICRRGSEIVYCWGFYISLLGLSDLVLLRLCWLLRCLYCYRPRSLRAFPSAVYEEIQI